MALPGILGVTPTSIPGEDALSCRGCRRGARKSPRVLAAHAGVRKIGIAWSGSRANTLNRRRSIPLAALAPLFALPGIAWFSLQRSVDEEEIADVPQARRAASAPGARRFRRHGGAGRGARPCHQRRHEHRASWRRARAADVDPARRRRPTGAGTARRATPLVSDRSGCFASLGSATGTPWCATSRRRSTRRSLER